jgi:membrane complex biogenesis BtpA family protein
MGAVLDRAAADAEALAEAGFDGLMVENFSDVPFVRGAAGAETVAAMARAVAEVISQVPLPVGVNVLRNDVRSALGIAVATGAKFVRVNVHVGSMWTDQGLIEGQAAETLRARATLGADTALLADVHVKHATPPAGASLAQAAADTWHRGLADALIVSGAGTGCSVEEGELHMVRRAVPLAPLIVGSGASAASAAGLLSIADGIIVGSSVMREGRAGAAVEAARARAFVDAARTAKAT